MSKELARFVHRAGRSMRSRIRGMVRRCLLRSVDSSGSGQTVDVLSFSDREHLGVEHSEPYGFTSNPPSGSEGIALAVAGDSANTVVINLGSRSVRLSGLESGEVAMYHQDGASVVMRSNGDIEIFPTPGQKVHLGGTGGPAVARATDPVSPSDAMLAWGLVLETAINALAPGTFSPMNSFAGTVSSSFATIQSGGNGATST